MEARFEADIDSPFLPMPIKQGIDEPTAAALLERSEDFPGLHILTEWRRVYPYAPHAAHVVGYMGAITKDQWNDEFNDAGYLLNERVGQFGVEKSMETVLHGTWGKQVYEVDAANRPVRLIEDIPPINGFDVQLTIDLDYQQYAEQALETTLKARRTQLAPNPKIHKPDGTLEKMAPALPDEVYYKAPAGVRGHHELRRREHHRDGELPDVRQPLVRGRAVEREVLARSSRPSTPTARRSTPTSRSSSTAPCRAATTWARRSNRSPRSPPSTPG